MAKFTFLKYSPLDLVPKTALNRGFCEAKIKNMGFAVYHTEKGTGSGGGVGNHIDRSKGMEHTYKHADPDRILLNRNLIPKNDFSGMKLSDAINERIKDGYKAKRAPRRDSVKYLSHVLTGSHKDMKRIFKDQGEKKAWLQKNYDFISSEFGKDNIVRFTLHLDEKTPHVHAVTVPLTDDGRLSAKEVFGNKKDLSARQDRYAETMKEFGLQRGLKRTGIKHENAKDYYSRIEQARNNADNEVQEPSKNLLGVYKENSVLEMQNALISSNLALSDLQGKYEIEKIKSKSTEGSAEKTYKRLVEKSKEVMQLQKNAENVQELKNSYNNQLIDIVSNPELVKKLQQAIERGEVQKAEEKVVQKKEQKRGRGMGY